MGAIQRAPPPADWLIFMVKADLARIVHDTHGGFSHEEAAQLVDLLLDKIKSTLVSGETVKLAEAGIKENIDDTHHNNLIKNYLNQLQ